MRIAANSVVHELRVAADAKFMTPGRRGTIAMRDALASLAPDGACIDPPRTTPPLGIGRLAKTSPWDFAISSWPDYTKIRYVYPDYFDRATNPELLLVAESAWGSKFGQRNSGLAVMEEFSKLLAARAPLKVMAFGYQRGDSLSNFENLHSLMVRLIGDSEDDAEYVLFGVAWLDPTERKDAIVRGTTCGSVHTGP